MTKDQYIGLGIGSAMIIFICWWFYKEGKKDSGVEQADLPPDDTHGHPETEANLLLIAGDIYSDLKGFNAGGRHDIDTYSRALALSDYDFVRLYNLWNIKYSKDIVPWYSSGTTSLTKAINEDKAVPYTQWESTKKTMLQRLSKLNCK